MTMQPTETDHAAIARELWARGYSLRYIAGRLGVSEPAAARLVGAALLARRGRRDGRA